MRGSPLSTDSSTSVHDSTVWQVGREEDLSSRAKPGPTQALGNRSDSGGDFAVGRSGKFWAVTNKSACHTWTLSLAPADWRAGPSLALPEMRFSSTTESKT